MALFNSNKNCYISLLLDWLFLIACTSDFISHYVYPSVTPLFFLFITEKLIARPLPNFALISISMLGMIERNMADTH